MIYFKKLITLAFFLFLLSCTNSKDETNEIQVSHYTFSSIYIHEDDTNSTFYKLGYTDIAVSKEDKIFILDERNNTIKKIDLNGNVLEKFGGTGQNKKSLLNPTEIEVSKSGKVYILDWGNKRVMILNEQLKFINSFSINKFSYYIAPTLSVLAEDKLALAFPKINQPLIHILDSEGNSLLKFGNVQPFENPPFEGRSKVATIIMNKAKVISFNNKFYVFYQARPLLKIFNEKGSLIRSVTIQGDEISRLVKQDEERKERHAATNDNKYAYKWTRFYTDVLLTEKGNFLYFLPTKFGSIFLINNKGNTIKRYASKKMTKALLHLTEYALINKNIAIGLETKYNNLYKLYLAK